MEPIKKTVSNIQKNTYEIPKNYVKTMIVHYLMYESDLSFVDGDNTCILFNEDGSITLTTEYVSRT